MVMLQQSTIKQNEQFQQHCLKCDIHHHDDTTSTQTALYIMPRFTLVWTLLRKRMKMVKCTYANNTYFLSIKFIFTLAFINLLRHMSSTNKQILFDAWQHKLKQAKAKQTDINKLIMNYFIVEGYKEAAEMLQKESNTDTETDLSTLSERVHVRTALHNGKVQEAIERVNDLNPEILDTNAKLYFKLQQQHLIELIRQDKIPEALVFAQEELAPKGEENREFLDQIERTMALLAFENMQASPVADLLSDSQRQKTASELNAAILESQCLEKQPKLPNVLKMLVWAQGKIEERGIQFPKVLQFSTAELSVANPTTTDDGIAAASTTTPAATQPATITSQRH